MRNRGELAEGWYDPVTLRKAKASATINSSDGQAPKRPGASPKYGSPARKDESSDEELVGPSLPGQETAFYKASRTAGPAIPSLQDLELRRGRRSEPSRSCRPETTDKAILPEFEREESHTYGQDLRYDRELDRKQQKERLEELLPRAEAGTKDRILEKKREKADSNRAFASAKPEAGAVEEVPESDLLGDDDGGIEVFKKQKREMERKKNEREVRREEILRARNEEREERMNRYRAKEEKTMAGLVALAKARFG